MMLPPGKHARLVIQHMDASETVIEFNDRDAYSWQSTVHGLMIRRVTGRTTFPWQTVKSHTIIPAEDSYHPSDLPADAIDLDADAWTRMILNNTDHALATSSLIDTIQRLKDGVHRTVFGDDPTAEQS